MRAADRKGGRHMGTDRTTDLGPLRCKFSGIEVFEGGVISSGWTSRTVVRWVDVRAIYYDALRETVTVLLLPVFSTESKKVTLEGNDGVTVTARGEAADAVYAEAVAATRERMLAEAIARFKRREEIQFGRLRLSPEGITYPSRDWGKPRTVPWEAVKQVTLNNGEVELHEAGKKPQQRMFLPDNFDLVIGKASAVANLEVFLQLARDLAAGPGVRVIHYGKTCPGCSQSVRQRARLCRSCGHVFPPGSYSPEVEAFMAALAALTGAPNRPPAPAPKPGRFLGALSKGGMSRLFALVGDDTTSLKVIEESMKGLTDAEVQSLVDCLNGAPGSQAGASREPSAELKVRPPSQPGGEDLAALLNAQDQGGAEQLARVLNQSSPTDAARLAEQLAGAPPGEAGKMAADVNKATRAPMAGPASPPRPGPAAATIRCRCPGCGRKLTAKPEVVGKQAKCPGCGHRFQVLVPDRQ